MRRKRLLLLLPRSAVASRGTTFRNISISRVSFALRILTRTINTDDQYPKLCDILEGMCDILGGYKSQDERMGAGDGSD